MLDLNIVSRVFTAADGSRLEAVKNLQFQLKPHTFTCIVGPSGCGKTSTLRMILGLDTGFEGHINMGAEATVSAVFQEPRLLPWRTVEQNVRLALPKSKTNMLLDDLFEQLGLIPVRSFYPSELSLGLARRAAIARAFALAPELLILDEPFVSLDDYTAERLRKILLDVWQAHPTTALMVTHNIREAAELADTVLVFSERPASVLNTVTIDVPQKLRDDETIDNIVRQVRAAMSVTRTASV